MTREELEATGMTDADLEASVKKHFDVAIKLAGMPDDQQRQTMRGNWLRQVQVADEGGKVYRVRAGERIGSFGENSPDLHFGPEGPKKIGVT